ncbi:MAG: hypothetical protein ACR2O0_14950 [Rhizobiaceae bacterium]
MDELQLENRPQRSVWNTAALAVAIFLAIVFFAGFFGSAEVASVPVSQ